MSEEEKKDISSPGINYRTDHAERERERQPKAVNEDSNKAKGRIKREIGDADGGKIKQIKDLIKEAPDRAKMSGVEKYIDSKSIVSDNKDLHLKSTTSLSDPETAKQNLKSISNPGNTSKSLPNLKELPAKDIYRNGAGGRGGGGLGGSDDLLKIKKDFINPDDILSEKGIGKQPKQEPQQQVENNKQVAAEKPALRAKDLINKAKEAREQQTDLPAREAGSSKEVNQLSIQERIAKATAAKEKQPEKGNLSNQKSIKVTENEVKRPSPKPPKV